MQKKRRIVLGADHAGVFMKNKIAEYLEKKGFAFDDVGSFDAKSKDDYPDFALLAGKRVVENNCLGILVCDTGIGMSIIANKIKGIRAALVWNEFMARRAREHNDANVLCLGSKNLTIIKTLKIVRIWLNAKISSAGRHRRRVKKIKNYETKRN